MERIIINTKNYDYIVDIKTFRKNKGIYDAFYFLDGQNVFKDRYASYHKSLKANKILKRFLKPYIAIAIHSPNDINRFNLYTPFVISNINNKTQMYAQFIDDFNNIIIPTIEKKYNIKNRYLITSSLGTLPALELSDKFKAIALFSSAYFLNYNEIEKIIRTNDTFYYLACGLKEKSDEFYTARDYLESSNWFYKYAINHNLNAKLYIDTNGEHDEITWRRYLKLFIDEIKAL